MRSATWSTSRRESFERPPENLEGVARDLIRGVYKLKDRLLLVLDTRSRARGRGAEAATGVGKRKVEQVILTHSHSDHAGLLPAIRALYQPLVRAWSPALEGVERPLREGERLLMGDRFFEVWHVPAHSDDSVCLYCESEEVLFAGDTPLLVTGTENSFDDKFLKLLERLCLRPPRVIYFGHGEPVQDGCGARLRASLENVRHSLARQGGRP
jgi:glyoxylase-like metal-dependent hydrolase (beta-lactamase superfamily II)